MTFAVQRYWPKRSSSLLLVAALHPSPEIVADAWREWEELQLFDKADWADLRIFPTVARRVTDLGIRSELVPRLVGVRRFMWSKMQHRIVAVRPHLAALSEAGIVPLVTKGAARVAIDPREAAERYSHDVDMVIAEDHWEQAVDLLLAGGLTCQPDWPRDRAVHRMREARHALSFHRGEADIDLHQSALLLNRCRGDDDAMWARAVPAHLAGTPVLAPCASDRLMMALGHGLLHDTARPGDWALDAASAIRAAGFDWRVAEEEIVARGLSAFAQAGLSFLADVAGLPVPRDVRDRLADDAQPFFHEELESVFHFYLPRNNREEGARYFAEMERVRRAVSRRPTPVPAPVGVAPRSEGWRAASLYGVGAAGLHLPSSLDASASLQLHLRLPSGAFTQPGPIRFRLSCFPIFESVLADWQEPELPPGAVAQSREVALDVSGALLSLRQAQDLQLYAWGAEPVDLAGLEYEWQRIIATAPLPATPVAGAQPPPPPPPGLAMRARRKVKVLLPFMNHPAVRHPRKLLPALRNALNGRPDKKK